MATYYPRLSRYSSGSYGNDMLTYDWFKYSYPYNTFAVPIPNCTTYAYARSMEIAIQCGNADWYSIQHYNNPYWFNGESTFPHAKNWYNLAISSGLWQTSSTPQLGAIACFGEQVSGDNGHVAIVEKINNNGVTLSNSDYPSAYYPSGRIFYTCDTNLVVGSSANAIAKPFQGYIINPFSSGTVIDSMTIMYRRNGLIKVIQIGG